MLSSLFNRRKAELAATHNTLQLPEVGLRKFTFCANSKPAKVKAWFDELPITDYQVVSTQLYKALPELSRVTLTTAARAEILEHIRPLVFNCVAAVTDPLTKKPLAINDTEKKTALIALALLKHLAVAYCRNAVDALSERKSADGLKASYIHRALTTLAILLKTSYRLYTPVPSQVWHLVNGVYRLAREADIHNNNIPDPYDAIYSGSCNHSYLKCLALACARPLQLRSQEIEQVYSLLNEWVKLLVLENFTESSKALFAVLSDADLEPDYVDTFDHERLKQSGLVFDFRNLLSQLEKGSDHPEDNMPNLSASMRQHLFLHWGTRVQRRNQRTVCESEMEICVGLSNIHSQLIKGANFEEFVFGGTSKSSLLMSSEWGDSKSGKPESSAASQGVIYTMVVNNTGPKGFQLQCTDSPPQQLQAGELVGFREPGKRNWQLAVVRWVKRTDQYGVQFGMMIIGRRMEAYGASTITDSGRDSDFLRVLLIKEGVEDNIASLVTPNLVFSDKYPITLKKRGDTSRIQLGQRISSSASYGQYRYKSA